AEGMGRLRTAYEHWLEGRCKRRKQKLDTADQGQVVGEASSAKNRRRGPHGRPARFLTRADALTGPPRRASGRTTPRTRPPPPSTGERRPSPGTSPPIAVEGLATTRGRPRNCLAARTAWLCGVCP